MTVSPYMLRALELAALGRYSASPNPMVGCVIVQGGRVIGEGFHQQAGLPHAEIEALKVCGEDPAGATAYVTLEPCAHYGRTPPCADALISAGISRVVVATTDPDPRVNGIGSDRLRGAGVEVFLGDGAEAAALLNEKFFHSVQHHSPFVLLKAGLTLDGKLATVSRESRWITSADSRQKSLALREEYDAILVGSGTVIVDDPLLTRRLGWSKAVAGWIRVIVDGGGKVPREARVLSDGARTLLFTTMPEGYARSEGLEVIGMEAVGDRIPIEAVLIELGVRGIRSVVVEGGSLVHSNLIERKLWQKMVLFVAPMFVGGGSAPSILSGAGVGSLSEAFRFQFDSVEVVGPDLMITAYPEEKR